MRQDRAEKGAIRPETGPPAPRQRINTGQGQNEQNGGHRAGKRPASDASDQETGQKGRRADQEQARKTARPPSKEANERAKYSKDAEREAQHIQKQQKGQHRAARTNRNKAAALQTINNSGPQVVTRKKNRCTGLDKHHFFGQKPENRAFFDLKNSKKLTSPTADAERFQSLEKKSHKNSGSAGLSRFLDRR